MRVIVVGAGIGGLTLAAGLHRAGVEAAVFEQADELGKTQVGGGFHLWPNAIRALREIGLDKAAREIGAAIERTEFFSFNGRPLAQWPLNEVAQSLDAFDVGIARQDLMSLLFGQVDRRQVVSSAQLVDFAQDGSGVIARFADGRQERGDLLVGADGVRSVVRTKLLGAAEPDYAGYVQWQALAADKGELIPAGVERITFGGASRVVMHRVGDDRLFWACVRYVPASEAGRPPGRKAQLLKLFGAWPDPISSALEATPEEDIAGLPIYDRKPVARWGDRRVTLLGDAAHPMTTNTSQGGNQAIEDAVLLSRLLPSESDPAPVLRSYEQRRIERTTPLVKNSRLLANMNAWDGRLKVALRDRMFSVVVPNRGWTEMRKAVSTPL